MSQPGKNSIPKFIDALRTWLPAPATSVAVIQSIGQDMVDISLMLDDVQDDSELRRGSPAAHVVYGRSQTINSAIYSLMKVADRLGQLQDEKCRDIFYEESRNLCVGQGLDLHWRQHVQCPSIQEYITMVDNKTGSFFRLVTRLVVAETAEPPNSVNLFQFITLLGRYYQIRDDYQNLASEEYTTKKGFCDDLSEGKFSLPMIHFLQNAPSKTVDQARGLIFHGIDSDSKRPLDLDSKRWILSEMKKAGSLEYSYNVLKDMHEAMSTMFSDLEAELGESSKLKTFLLRLQL
ncbi:predicted protein [Uncinocarpus reesii 1704]|uniref:Geranylgeranyl pyrophosphate synthetase n=1 Tax=Uncinocarpus reesii (strain UAMH 1704) TaxID=336963 RepID=C4JFI5_UNCRE|nr:uncharacterized protein UREG_00999 [Uncinocarpus reesii 1704]EEP76150.1 predicted protein [Uncinocarpus reesii 1704]